MPRPSSTLAGTSPFFASIIVGLRAIREVTSWRTRPRPSLSTRSVLLRMIEVGGGQLVLEQFAERGFVIEHRVLGAQRIDRGIVVGEAARSDGAHRRR